MNGEAKKMDTPILDGMKVYYNFTKKHSALKGKTPSKEALIKVDGKNRWKTIIQNAVYTSKILTRLNISIQRSVFQALTS